MPDDKEKIPDPYRLLHRIHPVHLVENKRVAGRRRLSTGAFRHRQMSVDVEEMLNALGLDWRFTLGGHEDHGLVRFTAGFARSQNQIVQHDRLPDNEAHALVIGDKPGDVKESFRTNCEWISKPDDVD